MVDWCKNWLEWTTSKQSCYHLVTFKIFASLCRARKIFSPEYFLPVHVYHPSIHWILLLYLFWSLRYLSRDPLQIPRMVSNCTSPDNVIRLQLVSTAMTCISLCVFYKCIHGNCSKELPSYVAWSYKSKLTIRLTNKSHYFTVEIVRYTRILYYLSAYFLSVGLSSGFLLSCYLWSLKIWMKR